MKNKKIVIIVIFLLLVLLICLLLIFKNNDKDANIDYGDVIEPDNFVVDTTNQDNVSIIDNVKVNNSKKVQDKVYGKSLSGESSNTLYMDNASIKADINNDTCVFEGTLHNNSGKDIEELAIVVAFFNSKDKTIGNMEYSVENIKNAGTANITLSFEIDVSNAYRYTLTYDIVER